MLLTHLPMRPPASASGGALDLRVEIRPGVPAVAEVGGEIDMASAPWLRETLRGGFARDFATADGQRVMVAALTRGQFADLAAATRLAGTFAFLERVLHADFAVHGDRYAHRAAIAILLAPWFARRTVADLDAAFAGTSVPWARLANLTGSD